MEKEELIILKSNEFVNGYRAKFSDLFGEEFGGELISEHLINFKNEKKYNTYADFWDIYDFTNLNFFDVGINKERVSNGWLVGSISGDFFIMHNNGDIVLTTNMDKILFNFTEFIDFICRLIKLSILNYSNELKGSDFKDVLEGLKNTDEYNRFLNYYFSAMM